MVELQPGGIQTTLAITSMVQMRALAVDHAGDVFVAGTSTDGSNNDVIELPSAGGASSVMDVPIAAPAPDGLAVDLAGDLFVTNLYLNRVQELPIDQALFSHPVNGQLNVDASRPFTWSTIAAAEAYRLTAGSTPRGDLVDSGVLPPTHSAYEVPMLPSEPILYATLLTEEDGTCTRYQVVGFTVRQATPTTVGAPPGISTLPPSATTIGPALALTGEDAATPLAVSASLIILGLGANQFRRRAHLLS